jgi:hypothetical protein
MDELAHKATEIISQLQAASPKFTAIALDAVRAMAIAGFVWGFVGALGVCVTSFVLKKIYLPYVRKSDWDDEPVVILGGIALAAAFLGFGGMAFANLCDPWNYIGLARPELWIAARIIH